MFDIPVALMLVKKVDYSGALPILKPPNLLTYLLINSRVKLRKNHEINAIDRDKKKTIGSLE